MGNPGSKVFAVRMALSINFSPKWNLDSRFRGNDNDNDNDGDSE